MKDGRSRERRKDEPITRKKASRRWGVGFYSHSRKEAVQADKRESRTAFEDLFLK